MNCSKCQSTQIIKYGYTHGGKPRFRCQDCGRQFVENANQQPIDKATRQLIDKLLLERLALAVIAWVTSVSERCYRCTSIQLYYQTPKAVEVAQKNRIGWRFSKGVMWSFVDSKQNKQWIWLAVDADTREFIGVFIGYCSRHPAKRLWQSLPAVYRQCAICYSNCLIGVALVIA